MNCRNCGAEVNPSDSYCPSCGKPAGRWFNSLGLIIPLFILAGLCAIVGGCSLISGLSDPKNEYVGIAWFFAALGLGAAFVLGLLGWWLRRIR